MLQSEHDASCQRSVVAIKAPVNSSIRDLSEIEATLQELPVDSNTMAPSDSGLSAIGTFEEIPGKLSHGQSLNDYRKNHYRISHRHNGASVYKCRQRQCERN